MTMRTFTVGVEQLSAEENSYSSTRIFKRYIKYLNVAIECQSHTRICMYQRIHNNRQEHKWLTTKTKDYSNSDSNS